MNPHLIPVVVSVHEKEDASVPPSDGHSGSKGQVNIIDHDEFEPTPDYRDEQSQSSQHQSEEEKDKIDAALLAASIQSHEDRNTKKGKSRDQPSGALNDISAISQKSNYNHLRSSSINQLERQILQVPPENEPHDSDSPHINDLGRIANVDWLPQ